MTAPSSGKAGKTAASPPACLHAPRPHDTRRTPHTPQATCLMPQVTRHTPHATRHIPHATCHIATCHKPHASFHTPQVTRHTPHATRHMPCHPPDTAHRAPHTPHSTTGLSAAFHPLSLPAHRWRRITPTFPTPGTDTPALPPCIPTGANGHIMNRSGAVINRQCTIIVRNTHRHRRITHDHGARCHPMVHIHAFTHQDARQATACADNLHDCSCPAGKALIQIQCIIITLQNHTQHTPSRPRRTCRASRSTGGRILKYKSVADFLNMVKQRDPHQSEFLQAVEEVMISLWPFIEKNPS